MTRVSIIEIDLGDIDKIVATNVAELHGEAKTKLEELILQKKSAQKAIQDKLIQKTEQEININAIVSEIYEDLLKSGKEGCYASSIEEKIRPILGNMLSFVARMKSFLKEKGNEYILKKSRVRGSYVYCLEHFNKPE